MAQQSSADQLQTLVEALELGPLQKDFLRLRWLDQMRWMSGKARSSQKRYYMLRLTTIIGGVIIPALVSLNVRADVAETISWATFALSLVVAISAAIEEFFHYGERWRHFRRTVEELKSEGWQFLQLIENYTEFSSHEEAYLRFSARIESIFRRDIDAFINIVREREDQSTAGSE